LIGGTIPRRNSLLKCQGLKIEEDCKKAKDQKNGLKVAKGLKKAIINGLGPWRPPIWTVLF
jgi:hypothetical protein